MKWNWQQEGWPNFDYDQSVLADLEKCFLHQSGVLQGSMKHIDETHYSDLRITLMGTEALKTSEIEGEILKRESVQASLRKNFGLKADKIHISPAEEGIVEMMVALHRDYKSSLTHETLFKWHKMIMKGRHDLNNHGSYRTHKEPMQIISGADYAPKVHFEAPLSKNVQPEMNRFINWFNTSVSLPPLTRAGIAHFYFENIHPFEDGNGRIGRALVIKSLSQSIETPALIALSQVIQNQKKEYYRQLELFNTRLEITEWLKYFATTLLKAQNYSITLIDFLIAKTRLFDRLKGHLNERQEKALSRMFKEGPEGFKGGMSAENYIKITGATRDLSNLVEKGALTKTGERRHTRYWLSL